MDILLGILIIALVAFGAGFGFRGLIGRELKALHAEQVKILAEAKAEIEKLLGDIKAKI